MNYFSGLQELEANPPDRAETGRASVPILCQTASKAAEGRGVFLYALKLFLILQAAWQSQCDRARLSLSSFSELFPKELSIAAGVWELLAVAR